jgi:hypothetical protein
MRAALVTAMLAIVGATASPAVASPPSLQLMYPSSQVDAVRYDPTSPAFVSDWPVRVLPAADSAFELQVARPSLRRPITVTELQRRSDGTVRSRVLPAGTVTDFRAGGLQQFFQIVVRDAAGRALIRRDASFCPGWLRERVTPSSSETPTYPDVCGTWMGGNPFILGQVWGIERGWAAMGVGFDAGLIDLPDGTYPGTLSVTPHYRSLFRIPADQATIAFTMTVRTVTCCRPAAPRPFTAGPPVHSGAAAAPAAVAPAPERPTGPQMTSPDPATVPNLTAVPAWGVQTYVDPAGHDQLSFSATAWNAGPAPLSVDGFRRAHTDIMDAYQNFYRDGRRVGYQHVGTFEYDPRPGHEHWHFTDFATYNPLDASGATAVRSGKQAFCLAPTDAENLLVPGAVLRPDLLGFSGCGTKSSLSLSERLPAGWGDSYVQWLPGQSFDLTGVPNGKYQIEVLVNPLGRLIETTAADNRSLRTVWIGGRAGHRTARAAAYSGITG